MLVGDAGNDFLWGGLGNDTLIGGTGNDVFNFRNTTEGRDIISDFVIGEDKLNLSGIWQQLGVSNYSQAIAGGFLGIVQQGANTVIQIDIDGSSSSSSFNDLAILNNVTATNIQASSFTV